jgi:hypothetical protein
MEDCVKSGCLQCGQELPDKRYKFCNDTCKGLYKGDTSTNTGLEIVTGQEQGHELTSESEAVQSNCPDCGKTLTCVACDMTKTVDNLLITPQPPVSTGLIDWQTKLDTLPIGIPHPASVPDMTLSTVHERILRNGMKKGDWISTQAYAEQVRRYLYWTETELLAKEHIIPAWVKPLLKGRGGPKTRG